MCFVCSLKHDNKELSQWKVLSGRQDSGLCSPPSPPSPPSVRLLLFPHSNFPFIFLHGIYRLSHVYLLVISPKEHVSSTGVGTVSLFFTKSSLTPLFCGAKSTALAHSKSCTSVHWSNRRLTVLHFLNQELSSSVSISAHVRSQVWFCDPIGCSPPASSVHGILQARILEWVAIFSSRGIFPNQDQTWFFTTWAMLADNFLTVFAEGKRWLDYFYLLSVSSVFPMSSLTFTFWFPSGPKMTASLTCLPELETFRYTSLTLNRCSTWAEQ